MSTFKYLSLNCPVYKTGRMGTIATRNAQCATKYPARACRSLAAPQGHHGYSDTTVYNKFRRQTHCVRYLDAPISCVMLVPNIGTIPHPGHVPTKLRNLQTDEIQLHGCDGRACFPASASSRASARYPFARQKSKWPRLDDVSTSKTPRWISRVLSPRISRDFRRISLPRAAVENIARDKVSIDPSSTNYFDTRLTVFDHTLPWLSLRENRVLFTLS